VNWKIFFGMMTVPFVTLFFIVWWLSATIGLVVYPMLFAWYFGGFWWGFAGLVVWWVSLSFLVMFANSD
jgi:hypothetical protein